MGDSKDRWVGHGLILVVDDNARISSVLRELLETLGFRVLAARSGRAGLDLFRRHAAEIRAVLLDLRLPGESAAEVFDEMRRLRPEARVILVSGEPEGEAQRELAREGLAGFLPKPFDMARFTSILRRALGE